MLARTAYMSTRHVKSPCPHAAKQYAETELTVTDKRSYARLCEP
jgi:hypothetical protein